MHTRLSMLEKDASNVLALIADYVFSFAYVSVVRCRGGGDGGWKTVNDIRSLTRWEDAEGWIVDMGGEDLDALAEQLRDEYTQCVSAVIDAVKRVKKIVKKVDVYKARPLVLLRLKKLLHSVFETADGEDSEEDDSDPREVAEVCKKVIESKLCDERRQLEEGRAAWSSGEGQGAGGALRNGRRGGEGGDCFTETDRIVLDLVDLDAAGRGRMKVVRVGLCKESAWMRAALKVSRDLLFRGRELAAGRDEHFAVMVDAGDRPISLNVTLEACFMSRKTCMCDAGCQDPSHTLKEAQTARVSKLAAPVNAEVRKRRAVKPKEANFNFEDLQNIPCILILVEKGRMGDTFPQSMDCLDLRVRASDNMMTLVQVNPRP